MKCGECRFWNPHVSFDEEGAGDCRRRAPEPITEADFIIAGWLRALSTGMEPREDGFPPRYDGWENRRALWPCTLEDDLCGEFAPKNLRVGFV